MTAEGVKLSAEEMRASDWHYDAKVDLVADVDEAWEQAHLDEQRREQVAELRGEYERITADYQNGGNSEGLLVELRNLSEMVEGLTEEFKTHRSEILSAKGKKVNEKMKAAAHLDYTSLKDLQSLTDKINGIVDTVSGEASAQKAPLGSEARAAGEPTKTEQTEPEVKPAAESTPEEKPADNDTAKTETQQESGQPKREEKTEEKEEEKPPFQPEQVKVKGKDGKERLLKPEELSWWQPGKTVECISGWEQIGSVADGGIDNGSHMFLLDSGTGQLILRTADVPPTDNDSVVDERFRPRRLGEIKEIQVLTSEWSQTKQDEAARRDEYEVLVRTKDGREYRFVSTDSEMSREQARVAYGEKEKERRAAAQAREEERTKAIEGHEKELAMAELLGIKEDLHQISEAATIGLRDDGSNRLDENNFDSLHREIRRSVLSRRLEAVTAMLEGGASEDERRELAAEQAAIRAELSKLNAAGTALEFGEIKDNDGKVILEARGYQDYREALKGEIKARSAQLERYAERANKKDGLKPHERYAFEEARKALDEAIAVQLEYEAIDEYDKYQKQITNAGEATVTYKDSDNKVVTVDLRSDEKSKNGEILSLQGKLAELGVQIAAAQDFITRIEQNPNARYDKQTVAEVKEKRELIKAKNKQAEQIREVMRQLEEKARNLMTLRQVFYLQAHGRVEEDDAARSEMGIAYDVTNGNNEFFSYALTVALGSSGIQEQLKDSTLNADGLADILIGRMTQIHDDAERESSRGSGIARAVNSLRTLSLSSTFIDKAYYGIAGNDGVFSNKLTSEMLMMSGAQLLQAKRKALEAVRYRAGDYGRRSIDDEENKRWQKLRAAEENWAAKDASLMSDVMAAEDNLAEQDRKHPAGYKITAEIPVGYESIDQAIARDENAQRGQQRRREALGQAEEQLDSVVTGRLEELQPYRAEVDRYREDVFAKYDRLMSEWETEKKALKAQVDAKQTEIQGLLKQKQALEDERRRRLFQLDQEAASANGGRLREIQDERAGAIDKCAGKLDEINEKLAAAYQELVGLRPEKLADGGSFQEWLAEKGMQLDAEELEILQPYLDKMAEANRAFQTQRKFVSQVKSTWLFTVVGSFNNSKMSLTAGTNEMGGFFGRLDQTSHLRPDGVSNPEVMEANDAWNKNFGTGKFDAEAQRYLGENGDLQRIVAMCVQELRNPRSKYWAGNSDLSQSDGVRKLVDEMFDTYCNTEGRETIGKMSKEQREFDKQLVLIKIARDDLVRKYAVEAYGVWFTALKNKQWDKLTHSGVLMALTYGLVRGKNGSTRAMLDFIDLDEITAKIQAQIDKYYPEGNAEDERQYRELQEKIETEELIMREEMRKNNEAGRLQAEERISQLRRSVGNLGKRYDQLSSLELLKARVQRHKRYLDAAFPHGTLDERAQIRQQAVDTKRENDALIRRELEKSQENKPGLMRRIWRVFVGSENQPSVREETVKYQYTFSEEDYINTFLKSGDVELTDQQIRELVQRARERGDIVDGQTTRSSTDSNGTTKTEVIGLQTAEFKPIRLNLKADYSFKPRKFSDDAPTMDAYLNQPPEGRQAAADWLDAHDAFGDIIAMCSSPIDKGLIEDPEKLVEAINKINTNFSRIASIALDNSDANIAGLPGSDVKYNYMREMAEAAYCGWIENVLHTIGGAHPRRLIDDEGMPTDSNKKYVRDFNSILAAVRSSLGDLGSNSRNKSVYNEKIHAILDLNSKYYMGPEQDIYEPDPYGEAAYAFRYKDFVDGNLLQYLVMDVGKKVGYADSHGTLFAKWNEQSKRMELIPGMRMPDEILQVLREPLTDSDG